MKFFYCLSIIIMSLILGCNPPKFSAEESTRADPSDTQNEGATTGGPDVTEVKNKTEEELIVTGKGETEDPVKDSPKDSGIKGGHFDLDTSSRIYPLNKGRTDKHIHEYDDKYDVKGADFLKLFGGLSSLGELVSPEKKFRILIGNGKLSPLGVLKINSNETNVVKYQDELNVSQTYSLGGVAGTEKLTSLEINFPDDTFSKNGLLATETKCVKSNNPGKGGEYRNGALIIQVLDADDYSLDAEIGVASRGLLWEATLFWHKKDIGCYK